MSDIIQLMEGAVAHLIPAYANTEDMYRALDKCALTEDQIYDELDRRLGDRVHVLSAEQMAPIVVEILYDNFNSALFAETAHKMRFT